MLETGDVPVGKVNGKSKLTKSNRGVVVFFESVDDFPDTKENEGRRPSTCNRKKYREGAELLLKMIGLDGSGTDVMILTERLLRGIAEVPSDPYFWVRDWLAFGYDNLTKAAYADLRSRISRLKFTSNSNASLFEQFEMPAFETLMKDIDPQLEKAA